MKPSISLPQSVTLYITDHCQFRCTHCFLTDENTLNSTHMSSDLWRSLIPALGQEKVFMVLIAGGDPFRHPEFLDILAEVRRHRMLPLLSLNPLVYEKSSLARLRDLGIGHVQIGVPESLLSNQAGVPDPFSDLSSSLLNFSEEGIEVTVAVTLKQPVPDDIVMRLDRIASMGASRIKIDFWQKTGFGSLRGLAECNHEQRVELRALALRSQANIVFPDDQGVTLGSTEATPRLVIRADGSLRLSETMRPIASLSHLENPVDVILSKLDHWLDRNLRTVWERAAAGIGTFSLSRADRRSIGGSGLVFAYREGYSVVIADDLDTASHWFVALHELGHVALGLMRNGPSIGREIERSVNLWAVEQLRDVLAGWYYDQLHTLAAADDEPRLFRSIANELCWNFKLGSL